MPKPKKPYIHLWHKERSSLKENTIIQHHNNINVLLGKSDNVEATESSKENSR